MRLSELTSGLAGARVVGDPDIEVHQVVDDSRRVEPGDVFVAIRGMTVDGHDFVHRAHQRGAVVAVVETEVAANLVQVIVPDSTRALGWLAAAAAGRPADRLKLIGVTGTNGKTTTTYLVEAILRAAGLMPGVIGTVSYRFAGKETPASFTTPTPLELHAVLKEMVESRCSHLVMETSSAALAMERLEGMSFQVAAFTNLTQDHLDVHATMEAYFSAKRKLFAERLSRSGTAVAMIDDREGRGRAMLRAAPASARRLAVSVKPADSADVAVVAATSSIAGVRAELRTPRGDLEVTSGALIGEYNVANLALAAAVAEGLDLPHAAVAAGIAGLRGVPGRVERVPNRRGLDVFVDYAHTPDALERVIAALRPLTQGRLIVVFGCGGDRDRTKRPQMGHVVARDADLAVITSDNPRTEEPNAIIEMIRAGVREGARAALVVEPDRRQAIAYAVSAARSGDVVLIAGKGHEDYQVIGKTKIHFDDREEAARAVHALG